MKISNNKILSAKIKATLKLFFGIPFGLLFALFFAVYLDLNATEEESFLVAAIVCFVGAILCIWMVYSGVKQKRLITACYRFAAVMGGNSVMTLEKLGDALGIPSGQVRVKLDKMINLGYYENIYINHSHGTVVVLKQEQSYFGMDTVMVSCEACGGVTKVAVGQKGVCDYCGCPIVGE